jgi:hypothetical protein
MGYTTKFTGCFKLNTKLDDNTFEFLKKLANTRRVKRDPQILEQLGHGNAANFGVDGEFFVDGKGFMGQDTDDSVIDGSTAPATQPGLWCQWEPLDDRKSIAWDGNEKFYKATEWIDYIIKHVLQPKGYIVNGSVNAKGEDRGDSWHITISDNVVSTGLGRTIITKKPSPKKVKV